MPRYPRSLRTHAIAGGILLTLLASPALEAQQTPPRFGGAYSELDERRRLLVNDWVSRFTKTTGRKLEASSFYDDVLSLSAKTTFEAVTHALMTTRLTGVSGEAMSDALALVERVDSLRGEVDREPGDRQFRMYVRLTPDARRQLEGSREFKRRADNSVYHKGYPLNYRQQQGVPSIQISIALDNRHADIDVDYRSATFPASMFNGHLSAANSDVRSGNNADRHAERWTGFQNWWRNVFGVSIRRTPDEPENRSSLALHKTPRAGRSTIDVMVRDFLQAWLVDGDAAAAMGYVADRAYSCLAQDAPDPSAFDRGLAPFQLFVRLQAAQEALGPRDSLEGLTVGVRLVVPGVKVVRHPRHAQFVIYAVPDDVAATLDCESRLTPGDRTKGSRVYGQFFASTFNISGPQNQRVALLWAEDNGYWKIVSWKVGTDEANTAPPPPIPDVKIARIKADPAFAQAARGFLETWLVRKDYDAAFQVLLPRSYACYDLTRGPDQAASASLDAAGRQVRASMEQIGRSVGPSQRLESILTAADQIHPLVRAMDHAGSRTFALVSLPNTIGDHFECDARARGAVPPEPVPLEYGEAYGATVRFLTQAGEAPVLRLLWRRADGAWRISAFDVELP